eukprot:m.146001 g.146001  ORF g.146001 m.146001 type:complete len:117 (-) comp11638_c2_seq5:201-551(-)
MMDGCGGRVPISRVAWVWRSCPVGVMVLPYETCACVGVRRMGEGQWVWRPRPLRDVCVRMQRLEYPDTGRRAVGVEILPLTWRVVSWCSVWGSWALRGVWCHVVMVLPYEACACVE